MKIIAIAWRDPNGNLKGERFNADDFSVRTEPGWLKIVGKEGIFRLIPSDKVRVVEFGEEEEPSRIASPHAAPPLPIDPKNFQPS